MPLISIRTATIEDALLILNFVRELAEYEKAPHEVKASSRDYETSLFAENSFAHALICEKYGIPIGYAVYFFNYSTWQGKPGLYLEDLYISPDYRGLGAGKAMLKHLAKIALEKGCGRFEWSVLDWNKPAINFYESIGARAQAEWVKYRLEGQSLNSFATS
ncbi:MAG: GNAT family N-acetyltransferase [Desulfobacula sp.]|nr:GNAT family N-acetyltransferase [Desulfobacula sp.]